MGQQQLNGLCMPTFGSQKQRSKSLQVSEADRPKGGECNTIFVVSHTANRYMRHEVNLYTAALAGFWYRHVRIAMAWTFTCWCPLVLYCGDA